MIETAMILAAGRGERLRPLTDSIPKALCLVHGRPLIEYHVMRLAAAGFQRIVINHAYLGGQIRDYLGDGSRFGTAIVYAPEPPGGLETGGGIKNALPLLGEQPFLSVNADIYTDFPLQSLQIMTTTSLHLVLVPTPKSYPAADFGLDPSHRVQNEHRQYTYAGIAVYHPALFEHILPGRYSLTPMLRRLAEQHRITGEVYRGQWMDIGSMQRLDMANAMPNHSNCAV